MSHERTEVNTDEPVVHTLDRLEDVPEPTPAGDFVVIDVIISSTSIVQLFEADAAYVKPFANVDTALAFAETTNDAFLVGEQEGRAIDGFDSGPLPSVLDTHNIEERPVGILTSNGTRAVERIGYDREIFVASTVNAAAIASALEGRGRDVWLVAAGRRGNPTPEDSAGVELVKRHFSGNLTETAEETIKTDIRTSGTARWLTELGFEHEVEQLLQFNSSDIVPRMKNGVFGTV
ncbi:2-phosphosulfolactate phosphatase [Halocatena salina]|uniref:2-phosphosulfolactate phosphatase n=1 Tax=Halocatena salina TaxID=2934340 RepID=A0A8U0ABQ9_9EURY|nr:2-phosphosulfolactate phosphatase [Halocatena salina]UPM45197.1 2-phosphosulfolactate phosphatase [Halocatena salina]